MCTFAEPRNSLLKDAHELYPTLKNDAYIIEYVNAEVLGCFMRGVTSLGNLKRITCPHIIPHKLAFVKPATFCTLCTGHPCSICSEIGQEPYFTAYISNRQTYLFFFRSKVGTHFNFGSWTLSHSASFTFHALPRNNSLHGLLPPTHLTALVQSNKCEDDNHFFQVLCAKSFAAPW
jgi:hypothetical protein